MDEFRDQESARDMAKMGLAIYRGLIADGATPQEAEAVLAALFKGMVGAVALSADSE